MDSGDNWLGVASILISAVALAGVAYSLVLQSHALRVAQAQATRATQIELIRMLIENPQIETPFAHDRDGRGAYLHLNLLMKHHEFGFLIGDFSEGSIRTQMAPVFEHESGRNYWQRARPIFVAEANTKRKRRFVAILDEELARTGIA
jgi:hypothetical protein